MDKPTNLHLFVGLAGWLAHSKTSGFDSRWPEARRLRLLLWCEHLLSRDTFLA